MWDVPGGHIEKYETPEETLARELEEELGIKAQIPTDAPNETLMIDDFELSLFVVERWVGEIRNQAPHEHDELRWVAREDLARLTLAHSSLADVLKRTMRD